MADGFAGLYQPNTPGHPVNAIGLLVQSMLSGLATATLARVITVTPGAGSPPAAGTVTVLPLVQLTDGVGNVRAHGVTPQLPYLRLQCGVSAIVIDPVPNDLALVICCDHDISAVRAAAPSVNVASWMGSPPGSFRRFDLADGVVIVGLDGLLGLVPTQFVQFLANGAGINIVTPGAINITATGAITVTSAATATVNCKDAVVHGSHSYSWDVDGYGERTTFAGGSNITVDTYKTGAVVTTNDHAWTPPALPVP